MFKKAIITALLTAVSLSAAASEYYVVVPVRGKVGAAAPKAAITVSLSTYTLPAGVVNQAYSGFDFNTVLTVQGDSGFSSSGVAWSSPGGGLPAGMSLSSTGVLSGTPTAKNTAGAAFQVMATYKTKSGQQAYTIIVNGVELSVTKLSAGGAHACAVTAAGGLKCWGANSFGQLGDGTTTARTTPVDVAGLTGVVEVAAGGEHTCALTSTGAVKCWGYNGYGELGAGDNTGRLTPVGAVGLTAGVAQIAASQYGTCAVTTAGGAQCWGSNSHGQLGDGTTTDRNVPASVSGLSTGVAKLSSGYLHACALTTAGAVKCWGHNGLGEVGDGTTTNRTIPTPVAGVSGVAQIEAASSGFHTCARTTGGGAKCWGYGAEGQIGSGSKAVVQASPADVTGLTSGVKHLSVGDGHSCAVMLNGAVQCWGRNTEGQRGDSYYGSVAVPMGELAGVALATQVFSGRFYNCAVLADQSAKCWGQNSSGQLGDGTTTSRYAPAPVKP